MCAAVFFPQFKQLLSLNKNTSSNKRIILHVKLTYNLLSRLHPYIKSNYRNQRYLPEGPMIATSCPGLKYREIPFNITFTFSFCSGILFSQFAVFLTSSSKNFFTTLPILGKGRASLSSIRRGKLLCNESVFSLSLSSL